jgi:epoxyqueuosine reductase
MTPIKSHSDELNRLFSSLYGDIPDLTGRQCKVPLWFNRGVRLPQAQVIDLARKCGFELAGAARAWPLPEAAYYLDWVRQGMAGEMTYLVDRRAQVRRDPRSLLPSACSIICVGKLYNGPEPYSTSLTAEELGWISRYAWGEDYHCVLRQGLERLVARLEAALGIGFDWKICVDTAPLLERAYARRAGLGWIAKNTCLINEHQGSWFFLGEMLTSLDIEPGSPPPDRCGTCTRCIDACPTGAIAPTGRPEGPSHAVDSRLCISYFTIEFRGSVPEGLRGRMGNQVFGCDICQDVCPWNNEAPISRETAFAAAHFAPPLDRLAALSEQEFRDLFRPSPVPRAKYEGFLRNVAIAMGNSRLQRFREPLEKLACSPAPLVAEHARWALDQLG